MTLYPKGDLNRIWLVLGALDSLEDPTLPNITAAVGLPKPSVNDVLIKLCNDQVAGVKVEKQAGAGAYRYAITEWQDFRASVRELYLSHNPQSK